MVGVGVEVTSTIESLELVDMMATRINSQHRIITNKYVRQLNLILSSNQNTKKYLNIKVFIISQGISYLSIYNDK